MSIQPVQQICPQSKWSIKCPYILIPEGICVHNTANNASALNEITYMNNNDAQVSFHYAVDDKEVRQGILWNRNAWHAGDGANGKGNRNYIAIEICYSLGGGEKFDKAEKLAAKFIAQLLKENNWDIKNVKKHQDFSGKYCVAVDATELLTPEGWKNLGELVEGDLVAQWDNGKITFAPIQHLTEPYTAEVIKARGVEATANHDIIYKLQKSPEWQRGKWGELLDGGNFYLPVGGDYDGKGLPISDDYLRFLIWVQADGHYAKRVSKYTGKTHSLGVEFHFSKECKVKRLIEILESLDQKYSYHERKDGTYSIRIHDATKVAEIEEWLDNKQFSWKFLEMDKRQREIFLSEILLADGSTQNRSYFSTKQQNYDVVAAIAALNNLRCLQTTTGTSTALIFTDSRLCVTPASERQTRTTTVSCVEVPSHNILIRQYGRPVVVGNCPHRTLDYGWERFLGMIQTELNALNKPVIEWVDEETKSYVMVTDTALKNVHTGEVVRNFGTGVVLEFCQHCIANNVGYYRTPWSRDNNIDNGIPMQDVAPYEPEKERISWEALEEPVKKVALRDCKLIDLKTGDIKKEYTLGEIIEDLVDTTMVGGETYYRPKSVKEQKKSYGIESFQLGDYTEEKEPAPDYEDITQPIEVEPLPTGDNGIYDDKPNGFLLILQTIWSFVKGLFTRNK